MCAVTTHVPASRRKFALAGGLLALTLPALTSCGFNYATDRPNEIINGGTALSDGARVNAARIVTDSKGSGTFIATISLNPKKNAPTTVERPTFNGLESTPEAEDTVQPVRDFSVKVKKTGVIDLADPKVGGIPVSGDFIPGDSVPLKLSFEGSEPVTVQVPVVTKCGPYADVVAQGAATSGSKSSKKSSSKATSSPSASASSASSESASPEASSKPTESSSSKATESSSSESSASTSKTAESWKDPYSCDFPPAELPGHSE